MSVSIYRFTRDLRLDDHWGLTSAADLGEVLPVLVIDHGTTRRLSRSPRRAAFFCAAVRALDASLRERGSRLIVRRGPVGATLRSIARASGAAGVTWSARYDVPGASADAALQSELEEAGLRATIVHDAPAIPPEETDAARSDGGDGYRAFVPYFERWREIAPHVYEAPLLVRFAASELQSETLPSAQEFGAEECSGEVSSAVASAQLESFLNGPGLQYAIAANVPADDSTSHLSAHLSFGTVAARTAMRRTQERSRDPFLLVEERASLRLFSRSLAMRDFFLQLAWYHRVDDEPLQEKMRGFRFAASHPALDAWRAGETGYPLVDAGIRQLHATGWMHPHVRAVAASFLCFDLGVDWRVGRDEWARYATDDEPVVATGNWQWIAGIGADMAQYPRIYNPEKQRRRFDPHGAYVRQWVEELAHAPNLAASKASRAQIELPLFAGAVYPVPVVDHDVEARAFLTRYREFLSKAPNGT
jgi:deoxyribodipyrimidine photo-lyase